MNSDLLISGRLRDLGGFLVHRSLPAPKCRSVGPYVFLDHMKTPVVDDTHKLSVRPHPHIGLATVTYLFEGRGFHRDTLGSKQVITPGDINWMTAGRGIAHSERTPEGDLGSHGSLHGVQIWVALPKEHEECEPEFVHYPKETLPSIDLGSSLRAKLLIGEFQKAISPIATKSRTLFMDFQCQEKISTNLEFDEEEVAIFSVEGELSVNDSSLATDDLLVISHPESVRVEASKGARFLVIGGSPHAEPRFIWWNFVSSSKERIHRAAADWTAGRFGFVEGETDFIPLPSDPLP